MFDIIKISQRSLLNYHLSVKYDIANKHSQSKVKLHPDPTKSTETYQQHISCYRRRLTYHVAMLVLCCQSTIGESDCKIHSGGMIQSTSTLNMNAPRPKNKDPKFIRSIVLMTEDKMPPRKRYSRRFANRAAPVKHAKIAVEPRNAIITILQEPLCQESQKNRSRILSSLVRTIMTTYIIHLSWDLILSLAQ